MSRKSPDKAKIITFKADQSLLAAMQGVENRSEFIRSAVLAALENICPLCSGRGLLTPNQQEHWNALALDHGLRECDDCHEVYLVCARRKRRGAVHTGRPARPTEADQ